VLWRPGVIDPPPRLIIGRFRPGHPPTLDQVQELALQPSLVSNELWERAAADCHLSDGVYHYWFEVTETCPRTGSPAGSLVRCTDPTAWTVDWRLPSANGDAALSVVCYRAGELSPCDPGGEVPDWADERTPADLPINSHLVIYELPTTWARGNGGAVELAVGTFRDILALLDPDQEGANFSTTPALAHGQAILRELGINALELLPPADSCLDRQWGYGTSNYFAADFDLGLPGGHDAPTATLDLTALVQLCHRHAIRLFADMVLAYGRQTAYRHANYADFHVNSDQQPPDPELWMMRCNGKGTQRTDWGGDLFKYGYEVTGYDPIAGTEQTFVPARQFILLQLDRWLRDFHIDGIRLDSVENIGKMDFVREVKDHAHALWRARCAPYGLSDADAAARFLVVGEELSLPLCLVTDHYVDALWNEEFKRRVRYAIMGQNAPGDQTFECTVRRLIDCRQLGFPTGQQAINYVTSHDVGGFRNERLYNLLQNNGVAETEQRIKLAFACLLTAVGIPMILAGEEFGDQHDRPPTDAEKQIDPVNYDRLADPWRREIFDYVARLVQLRTTSNALAGDEIQVFHVDFTAGKRVLAWQRG
jgi:pullulanase